MSFYTDEEYEEAQEEYEERDPWGCRYPDDCVMCDPHRISECCTPEMIEALESHGE